MEDVFKAYENGTKALKGIAFHLITTVFFYFTLFCANLKVFSTISLFIFCFSLLFVSLQPFQLLQNRLDLLLGHITAGIVDNVPQRDRVCHRKHRVAHNHRQFPLQQCPCLWILQHLSHGDVIIFQVHLQSLLSAFRSKPFCIFYAVCKNCVPAAVFVPADMIKS